MSRQAVTERSIEISVKGKWVTAPALEVDGKTIVVKGKWLKTAMIHDEAWLAEELDDPDACIRDLKERKGRGIRADLFTFSQKPSATEPKHSYQLEWDSVAAIRLDSFDQWWEGLAQEGRKNVRRAQKRGVEIKLCDFDDDLIRAIMDVNNDSPVRQQTPNVHFGKSFEQVRKDHSSFVDRSDFICAYAGSEAIGYAKIVYRGEVASILNFVPKASHQDKRPANAMIAKIVELCEAKGVRVLTYGMFNYGNKRESSLREFKTRNGFEEILVPRFYIPLTALGTLSIRLKVHRGLLAVVPSGVIKLWGSTRALWYSKTHKVSRCSSIVEQPNSNRQMERASPPAGSKNEPVSSRAK
jgi:hypothetical protein